MRVGKVDEGKLELNYLNFGSWFFIKIFLFVYFIVICLFTSFFYYVFLVSFFIYGIDLGEYRLI